MDLCCSVLSTPTASANSIGVVGAGVLLFGIVVGVAVACGVPAAVVVIFLAAVRANGEGDEGAR